MISITKFTNTQVLVKSMTVAFLLCTPQIATAQQDMRMIAPDEPELVFPEAENTSENGVRGSGLVIDVPTNTNQVNRPDTREVDVQNIFQIDIDEIDDITDNTTQPPNPFENTQDTTQTGTQSQPTPQTPPAPLMPVDNTPSQVQEPAPLTQRAQPSECELSHYERFVGMTINQNAEAALRQMYPEDVARIERSNTPPRELLVNERLNIVVDDNDIVVEIYCG